MSRSTEQPRWSNQIGFILATTGAAVGLGNIWKFAYMAGTHGGSAFVLIYLLCVLLVGIPLMMGEMTLGRLGRSDAITSLQRLAQTHHAHPAWRYLGWLGAITLLCVLSFYSVVAGWSLCYWLKAATNSFYHVSTSHIQTLWSNLLNDPVQLMTYHALFMLMTVGVVAQGIQKGLEKAARMLMPALFIILIGLVIYSLNTPGAAQGIDFLFHFNLSNITPTIAISALGHAFFTLAVGAGCILVYGAYLPDQAPIARTVLVITALDVLVAILSGLAIFPLVFTYHLSPASGPGLMFETLPIIFSQMAAGRWFGSLFFMLLLFAAWTSSISLLEPWVALLVERFNFRRKPACYLMGGIAWILGLVTVLSFNHWSNFKPLLNATLFDLITDTTTNLLLPLGGLGFAWFAGHYIPEDALKKALNFKHVLSFKFFQFNLKYTVPLGILVIVLEALIK
ncbi:MAG: sodium-dependent transporter [Legionellales bacterium]|nr:sodium-dependent transporter [Legionellales bacterium]